jgi:Domain of unknown function (DUF4149)
MLALRYAALLAIAAWIGGLLVLGAIAAPAIFDVTALRQIPDSRVLAGAIFGEIFRRFHLVSYACGAVLVLSLCIRAVLGPRPRRFSLRLAIAAMMIAAALYSGFVLSPSIEHLQQSVGANVSIASLAVNDPRRIAFGRLHGRSTLLQLVPLVGGLILIFWELKD